MALSFTRRARIAYHLAWLPMAALVGFVFALRGMAWYEAAGFSIGLSVPYAVICGSSYYMARAMPLRRIRLIEVLLSLLGASCAASGIWVSVAYGVAQLIGGPYGRSLLAQLHLLFGVGVAYFALSLAFHYLVLALLDIRRAERHADEARVLTREAELRALRAQLNPHFLFNSLNSIAALTTRHPEEARVMCQLLSDFLRLTLRQGDLDHLKLKDELILARKYLDIERVRFQDRMRVEEQIDDSCLEVLLPPLIVQPLLENAIKHGVAGLDSAALIKLDISRRGDQVVVAVENNMDPETRQQGSKGRGLGIVRDRLASYYGDQAKIVVQKDKTRFNVALYLPSKTETEEL